MPAAQTLFSTQMGIYTTVLLLQDLGVGITSTGTSSVYFIQPQETTGDSNPPAPYQFIVQYGAAGGGGSASAQAFLMTSFDEGVTWLPVVEIPEIVPSQDVMIAAPVQSMGGLVGVAWILAGAPAPTVTGKAWLVSTEVFKSTARTTLTVDTTYATPSASQTEATEAWVTNELEQLTWKAPAAVATTGALPAYTRVGNVLTANANGALPAVDGVTLAVGNRLLLKDGAAAADNGVYSVTSLGAGGSPWVLTRSTDMDASAKVQTNIALLINQGTVSAGLIYRLSTTGAITLNTTALTFTAVLRSASPSAQSDVINLSTYQTLTWKIPVRVATATTLPAYTRVGNVLTANANGALPTVDGVTLAVADRLLQKNGAAGADNGIYAVTDLGSAGTPWILTRAEDMDSSAKVRTNACVLVDSGSTLIGMTFKLTTTGVIILNTTALTFAADMKVPTAVVDADAVNLDTLLARATKAPVRAATTVVAGLPAYTRVSNVLTANANGALPAIDGVTLVVGDRLLVRNGAAGADNGIYTLTDAGSAGTPWIMTRASDYAATADIHTGDTIPVGEGTLWAGALFMQTTSGALTLNTTALVFTKYAGTTPAEVEVTTYTVNNDDELVVVDTTAGNQIITLPGINTRRRRPVTVSNPTAANNAVVTAAGGETVKGGATLNVGPRTSVQIMGPRTGTDWIVVS